MIRECVRVAVLSALVAGAMPVVAAGAATAPPSRAALVRHADEVVAAGVPGVEVRTRDRLGVRSVVAGVGDRRTGGPPRAGGPFRAGSVTKTFTAATVLSLAADGRIRLDAPIDRYLPGLLPYSERITVRQLLQHRSGLFEYGEVLWATPELAAASRYRDYAPADLVRIAAKRPLQFTPGSRFGYSNTDYVVLGLLVERVTHQRYATALARRVLRPAGLRHTHVAGHDPALPRPSMHGYEAIRPKPRLTDLTGYNMSVAWASGDLVSTTGDINRFSSALLGGRLLPPNLLRQMKRSEPAFPGFEYGLGLGHAEMCGQQVWGHIGGVPGYGTYAFTSPGTARQITVSVNRSLTLSASAKTAINTLVAAEFCGDTGTR